MAFFSFYRVRKPRKYNYQPIYWDPRKENLEERTRKIKREMGLEKVDENYKPQIKGTFVEGTSHLKKRIEKGETPRSRAYKNIKLVLALVLLGVVLWYLFFK